MAYTETDLTNVEAAIRALMSGTRKVSFSMGDKSVTYAQTDLDELRELKHDILGEVQTVAARPRFFLASTGKGL